VIPAEFLHEKVNLLTLKTTGYYVIWTCFRVRGNSHDTIHNLTRIQGTSSTSEKWWWTV